MNATPAVLGPDDLAAALERLPDWRSRLGALQTAYVAPSAAATLALVADIGQAAESVGHHPPHPAPPPGAYQAVVGARETTSDTVSLRLRNGLSLDPMPTHEAVERIITATASHSLEL
jgi:Pterin 4 alpha carbinolamine dehydratase